MSASAVFPLHSERSRRVAVGFCLLTLVWNAGVIAAPMLSVQHTVATGRVAAAGVYLVGSLVCHQRPERSFTLVDLHLPVCARCTGIYTGATLGAFCALLIGAGASIGRWRQALIAAVVPTLLTLFLEHGAGMVITNIARALAAIPIGIATGWIVAAALSGDLR